MTASPSIDFVLFYVSDLEQSLAFFHDRLGFERVPEQDTPAFYYLRSGASGIDFGLSQARAGSPPAGAVEVYFKTPELAELRAELAERGAAAGPIVQLPFGAIFGVSAPDGHHITMMGPRP
jgi:catechol 2,3-dioxygenase-like lactoylglutathione lyase family enzyme